MRFFTAIVVFLLVAALSESAVVQRRIYRNTEEVLVPVTVIQDGDEIKEVKDVNVVVEPQVKSIETEAIAQDIAKAVDEEEKLEAVEEVVEAQRRFDEAVVEEEIKEAVAEENKEILKAVLDEEKLEQELIEAEKNAEQKEQQLKLVPEISQEAVIKPEAAVPEAESLVKIGEEEPLQHIKSVVVEKETPDQVVVVVETSNEEEQPDGIVRQATQATPGSQATTQQNFIQQFLQNLPGAQLFNQITGQNPQVSSDEAAPATPAPTIPGFLNPFTNAAQTAVNTTSQALQGIQQFASNLGNQFQNTLSSLTGQQQLGANDATTARPPGPIQQFVNTIMGGNQQQSQPAPGQQQGPLQGLLNIFQGNNRPQGAAITTEPAKEPSKEPAIVEQANDTPEEISPNSPDNLSNELRNSAEAADSFEESVQPDEMIVVNDDENETGNEHHERSHVPK